MKHGTPDLLKFKRLQRALGESTRGTVGLLELLWIATIKNAPQGNIGKFEDEEIAILCDWPGEPEQLIAALVSTGWVDEHPEERLVIHDWAFHAPDFVKANLKSHKRAIIKTDKPPPAQATCLSNLLEQPAQARRSMQGTTKPNQTKPNITQPNQGDFGASRKPGRWPGMVTREHVFDDAWILAMLDSAPPSYQSEEARLGIVAIAVRARRRGDDPAAMFAGMVRKRQWDNASADEMDVARQIMRDRQRVAVIPIVPADLFKPKE